MSAMLTAEEALAALLASAKPAHAYETVNTLDAAGRVLAQDVQATLNVPPMDNTQMDGYALRSSDVKVLNTKLRVSQRVPAGHVPKPLEPGTAARIFTGAMIPPGADTVVMQEQCEAIDGDVLVKHLPQVGEWMRRSGCDIREGDTVLSAGALLSRPCELASSQAINGSGIFYG
jgi:molybdopterin molybdotransferase